MKGTLTIKGGRHYFNVSKDEAASTLARPYDALAVNIAAALKAQEGKAKDAGKAQESVWGLFRSALAIADKAGHDAKTLKAGLELACVKHEVPKGTARSYSATVAALRTELTLGTDNARKAGLVVNFPVMKDEEGKTMKAADGETPLYDKSPLDADKVEHLSIKDARKRYKEAEAVRAQTEAEKAVDELVEAVAGWTAEGIRSVIEAVKQARADEEAEAEVGKQIEHLRRQAQAA